MTMQFLTPTSRRYPFDEACSLIVEAVAARDFEVPGLHVVLEDYGSGEQKMRFVSRILCDDARISFCREQGRLPGHHLNDIAAASAIGIPGMILTVYGDESGPTLVVYVGGDWARDRDRFWGGLHVNSKLHGEPRTYLRYRRNGGVLDHDDDLGREYSPTGAEPTCYRTGEVMARVRDHLVDVVLPRILAHPPAAHPVDPCAPPEVVPVPDGVGPLFGIASYQDARRIRQPRADLHPADRYGMMPNWRLVPLYVGGVPRLAHDGFVWCGIGDVVVDDALRGPGTAIPVRRLQDALPGRPTNYDDYCGIRVRLSTAREVYVVDQAAWEERRVSLTAEVAPRDRFTDAEVGELHRARARTLVSLVEYAALVAAGRPYAAPMVLVRRELALDEVEAILPHDDAPR